ncbi:hypothetical protein T440DRAFT_521459 [Plenodomus tracheiphilus IPT5]|uniref:Uncharacterized protein n=1 Tax=Plenodomus tracheiphilus IPT5 TaxID=1408161 RepID=A0A6A7AU99_9PLEO|nr:hypothetical protein T440DRAFT_521459 [Plenodomus tracheiphilus IPT5]
MSYLQTQDTFLQPVGDEARSAASLLMASDASSRANPARRASNTPFKMIKENPEIAKKICEYVLGGTKLRLRILGVAPLRVGVWEPGFRELLDLCSQLSRETRIILWKCNTISLTNPESLAILSGNLFVDQFEAIASLELNGEVWNRSATDTDSPEFVAMNPLIASVPYWFTQLDMSFPGLPHLKRLHLQVNFSLQRLNIDDSDVDLARLRFQDAMGAMEAHAKRTEQQLSEWTRDDDRGVAITVDHDVLMGTNQLRHLR